MTSKISVCQMATSTAANRPCCLDVPMAITYQPHVYDMARQLAARSGASRIVDVGCGNCRKLLATARDIPIIGIDAAPALTDSPGALPCGTFFERDLETGLRGIDFDDFRERGRHLRQRPRNA